MSNAKEAAFPSSAKDDVSGQMHWNEGMTKREYFAAMAMQGMLCGFRVDERMTLQKINIAMNLLVEFSAKHADALLAELEKQKVREQSIEPK